MSKEGTQRGVEVVLDNRKAARPRFGTDGQVKGCHLIELASSKFLTTPFREIFR